MATPFQKAGCAILAIRPSSANKPGLLTAIKDSTIAITNIPAPPNIGVLRGPPPIRFNSTSSNAEQSPLETFFSKYHGFIYDGKADTTLEFKRLVDHCGWVKKPSAESKKYRFSPEDLEKRELARAEFHKAFQKEFNTKNINYLLKVAGAEECIGKEVCSESLKAGCGVVLM